MKEDRQYCIYILTNFTNTTLYIGVTGDLMRRIVEHKSGKGSVFTSKYNLTKLIYVEVTDDIHIALAREKQLKAWPRKHKIELIQTNNPSFQDLFLTLNS